MHELSIAMSLLALARTHLPAGARLSAVRVRVGPLRGIDPESMQYAWQAATVDTMASGAKLELEELPWQLGCQKCGATFSADRPDTACACGSLQVYPVGGDELLLMSIDVDPESPASG